MSWTEVARVFHTSWENVFHSVEMAVVWGREHIELDDVKAIGIDEILWHKGHKYLTVVYQIDEHRKRLLWLGEERRVKTLLKFFRWFGKQRSGALEFICSDMWRPYLKVIAKKASHAVHVLRQCSRARAGCCSTENLTDSQDVKLAELLQYNLRSVRSYLLKEDFQFFWKYVSPYWAGRFLDRWCTRVMRSKIEPMKKVARSLRKHRVLLLTGSALKGPSLPVSLRASTTKLNSLPEKPSDPDLQSCRSALFHTLGDLPEPETTHRFC